MTTITVPTVVGKKYQEAIDATLAAGFRAAVQFQVLASSNGTIVSQQPPPSTQLAQGSPITLVLSVSGEVPDTEGMTVEGARATLIVVRLRRRANALHDVGRRGRARRRHRSRGRNDAEPGIGAWCSSSTAPDLRKRNRRLMRVLGIDPALRTTGYGVIDAGGRRVRLVEAGVVAPRSDSPLEHRLHELHAGIAEVIAQTRPELVVIEELYTSYRNPGTALLMAHARGVLCLAAAEAGVAVHTLGHARVKRALVGSGSARKVTGQRDGDASARLAHRA